MVPWLFWFCLKSIFLDLLELIYGCARFPQECCRLSHIHSTDYSILCASQAIEVPLAKLMFNNYFKILRYSLQRDVTDTLSPEKFLYSSAAFPMSIGSPKDNANGEKKETMIKIFPTEHVAADLAETLTQAARTVHTTKDSANFSEAVKGCIIPAVALRIHVNPTYSVGSICFHTANFSEAVKGCIIPAVASTDSCKPHIFRWSDMRLASGLGSWTGKSISPICLWRRILNLTQPLINSICYQYPEACSSSAHQKMPAYWRYHLISISILSLVWQSNCTYILLPGNLFRLAHLSYLRNMIWSSERRMMEVSNLSTHHEEYIPLQTSEVKDRAEKMTEEELINYLETIPQFYKQKSTIFTGLDRKNSMKDDYILIKDSLKILEKATHERHSIFKPKFKELSRNIQLLKYFNELLTQINFSSMYSFNHQSSLDLVTFYCTQNRHPTLALTLLIRLSTNISLKMISCFTLLKKPGFETYIYGSRSLKLCELITFELDLIHGNRCLSSCTQKSQLLFSVICISPSSINTSYFPVCLLFSILQYFFSSIIIISYIEQGSVKICETIIDEQIYINTRSKLSFQAETSPSKKKRKPTENPTVLGVLSGEIKYNRIKQERFSRSVAILVSGRNRWYSIAIHHPKRRVNDFINLLLHTQKNKQWPLSWVFRGRGYKCWSYCYVINWVKNGNLHTLPPFLGWVFHMQPTGFEGATHRTVGSRSNSSKFRSFFMNFFGCQIETYLMIIFFFPALFKLFLMFLAPHLAFWMFFFCGLQSNEFCKFKFLSHISNTLKHNGIVYFRLNVINLSFWGCYKIKNLLHPQKSMTKSTIMFSKITCFFFNNKLLGLINEQIYFLIIDWFLILLVRKKHVLIKSGVSNMTKSTIKTSQLEFSTKFHSWGFFIFFTCIYMVFKMVDF
ncbi:putative signal peptide protein [Puccinia sorghi]|uniref:Putative signal peptide protein n=1 Tax=Puccinia sorghi TaxID=27349 RepID=A0A0L6V856_9BASI|nr:putative signal peptide protein [Puccinia sorghi]